MIEVTLRSTRGQTEPQAGEGRTMLVEKSTAMRGVQPGLLTKVPEVTLIFWVAKLGTTAFGEAFSDYVFFNDNIGRNAVILMAVALLAGCLIVQVATKRYIPVVYWLTVTAVSIFGTMSADYLNLNLGMPLWGSTVMLLGLQAVVFIAWYTSQKTLDMHSINTRPREVFYWLTVIFTFALGTAAGDFAAGPLGLGTLASTFVFLAVILLPAAGYRWLRFNEVFAFWFAYTITRPLGASFADWLGVPAPYGDGLHLGTGPMSLATGAVLVAVLALVITRHRSETARQNPLPEVG
ncbi:MULTISPECIES: hypothetical protein [unclassified Streptomyces]|uniref:COG4705 family protein n=2 Tax=unclassified Streptomyces TaxID=2593676 RepID=UPI002E1851B6|nr:MULTISPECIES: hypothetical protein [unclassified Streptomyces]